MIKKKKVGKVVILIMVLTIGSIMLLNSKPIQPIEQSNGDTYLSFSSQMIVFDTLEQVVEYADSIILGTVVEEESFSEALSRYTLEVDVNLKYSSEISDIDVYEEKGKLILGQSYILFLEELNHPLYSKNSYTSFDKGMIIETDHKEIITVNKLLSKEKDLQGVIKGISELNNEIKVPKMDYVVLDNLSSLNELYEESDYILHIMPNELNNRNKNVTEIEANIIKQYKGASLGKEISLFLPSNIQSQTEYMVFLKDYDGSLLPTTREGSLIEIGTTEFKEAFSLLNNYK